jgi:hypothetical protein
VPGDEGDSTSDTSIVDTPLDRVGDALQAFRRKTNILGGSDGVRDIGRR